MLFQVHLVSGGSDGLLILWSADHIHDSRELVPKISLKVALFCICICFCSFTIILIALPNSSAHILVNLICFMCLPQGS